MILINLRLDASISGLLGLSLDTLIRRTDSSARGIEQFRTAKEINEEDRIGYKAFQDAEE
jgi:hypothetical protein